MTGKVKSIIAMVGVLVFVSLIGGCNTVKGVGKDVQQGGEALQRAANKA